MDPPIRQVVFLFGWEHSIVGPILFCTHKSKTGGALCYDSLVRKERVCCRRGCVKAPAGRSRVR